MKRLLFIVTVLIFCYSISAQDFRKVSWGDSMAVVKASESGVEWEEFSDGSIYEDLGFETTIFGLKTYVGFTFIDNKLFLTAYNFDETHLSNRNLYITEFDRIDDLLQTKYGKGDKEEIWVNDEFKDDPSSHGDAISYGHYAIHVTWEIPDKTKISHSLTAGYNGIAHAVRYFSIELEEYVKEEGGGVF